MDVIEPVRPQVLRIARGRREAAIVQVRREQRRLSGWQSRKRLRPWTTLAISRARSCKAGLERVAQGPVIRREEDLVPVDAEVGDDPHAMVRGRELAGQINAHRAVRATRQAHVRNRCDPLAARVAHLKVRGNHPQPGV